ncbi:hypothetical protein N781_18055 [Pontibacillus halophilus JSM 076056 = DSM 19796]|uniref:3-dehydroquinate synthase C-terminal domain-containing protein n=1 Tax=Pontibacillus halophilus JSM 076056 = DSM 19796 TaxID=1385510 RepID=A0A0A5GM09_9BACI|nr:3-dehydroquinate synthase II [Pontibacillus halophilus]KGX92200.1 hypothetical protein N781_18055 [Pontibacillus halophilus JSM 076056 = DSM 19796]
MLNKRGFNEVVSINEIVEGMRVCIDFTDVIGEEESLFVGNTGHGYVQVFSENRVSKGYPPRPFRVNVGAFHQYLHQSERTYYLQELQAGEELELISGEQVRKVAIGRVKIEKRPMLQVACAKEDGEISATFQSASSVYVFERSKGITSILNLEEGDWIAALEDEPGRHLGKAIKETIIEK